MRRGRHLQNAGVGPPQQLRLLGERADGTKDAAAIAKQLLAFAGQHQPAADAIEQSDAELVFEVLDLARQRGLRDAQAEPSLGDGALLGDGDEGSQMAQVHGCKIMPVQHEVQSNNILDAMIVAEPMLSVDRHKEAVMKPHLL